MVKRKKKGFSTGFGPRYGKTNRQRLSLVRATHVGRQECPYCSYRAVRREASGIWNCSKCGSRFAGRAYKVSATKRGG